jgi:hypothetical protein
MVKSEMTGLTKKALQKIADELEKKQKQDDRKMEL